MLTCSVLWVVLAAALTMAAMRKGAVRPAHDQAPMQPKESENGLAVLAVLSCLVLVAGFVYVGRFLVAGL